MTGLGLIGTGIAVANYRKAQKELETLEEKRDGLVAAISTYNSNKLDEYLEEQDRLHPDNEKPDGLNVTTLLRVGNLVGKFFRVQCSVVLTNRSTKTYTITEASADCTCLGYPVVVFDSAITKGANKLAQYSSKRVTIKSGDTIEIFLPSGISSLNDKMGELRDTICAAAGKKLITSCPKINIEGIETADIVLKWQEVGSGIGSNVDDAVTDYVQQQVNSQPKTHTYWVMNKPGVLRYCGEAYYPKND